VSIRVQQERDFFKNIIAWDYEVKLPLVCEKFTSSIPGCWERNANQSLSVTPTKPFIFGPILVSGNLADLN
jgi:hypothetical protein